MLKIAVVEDELEFRNQIVGYIKEYALENDIHTEITEFSDGLKFTKDYNKDYDILLLDIELPSLNGMDAAIEVRKKDADVVIVFITFMAHYAIKGYEVDALDFILKPISYFAFKKRFSRAIKRTGKTSNRQLTLSCQDEITTINTDDLYYIESSNRYLHYYTATSKCSVRGTMKTVEEELAPLHFVRCNYWYLVNLKHVSSILSDHVVLGNYTLEISRRNKTAFRTAFTEYMQGSK